MPASQCVKTLKLNGFKDNTPKRKTQVSCWKHTEGQKLNRQTGSGPYFRRETNERVKYARAARISLARLCGITRSLQN